MEVHGTLFPKFPRAAFTGPGELRWKGAAALCEHRCRISTTHLPTGDVQPHSVPCQAQLMVNEKAHPDLWMSILWVVITWGKSSFCTGSVLQPRMEQKLPCCSYGCALGTNIHLLSTGILPSAVTLSKA